MLMSFCTSFSVNRRPISRFTANRVFFGLVTAWRLAGAPVRSRHRPCSDDRGRSARAFGVFNDLGLAVFHDGHARVSRSQVNADDLSHVVPLHWS